VEESDVQRLVLWVNAKWRNKECRLCGKNAWAAPQLVSLQVQPVLGSYVIGGTQLPTAAVVCTNCGNTELINLIVATIAKASGA